MSPGVGWSDLGADGDMDEQRHIQTDQGDD